MSWQLYRLNLSFDLEADSFNYNAPGQGTSAEQPKFKQKTLTTSIEKPKVPPTHGFKLKNRKTGQCTDSNGSHLQNGQCDPKVDMNTGNGYALHPKSGQWDPKAETAPATPKMHPPVKERWCDYAVGEVEMDEMELQAKERKYDTDLLGYGDSDGELNGRPPIPADVISAVQSFAEVAANEHYRREDLENHQMSVQLSPYIPLDDQGNVTSLGSILHHTDACKPCIFLKRDACHKRDLCFYCHFPHDESKLQPAGNKKRKAKKRRPYEANQRGVELQYAMPDGYRVVF
jgi:hypothetical protein